MAGIDRDYWLDFAKAGVSKSIESREKAAEKLDNFLSWAWLIYTSIFTLGSLMNFVSSNIWQLVCLAQPILIIMLARYFCALVTMPSTNNDDNFRADPNDVASIIDSFKIIVEDKKKKLSRAKFFSFVSIFSITVSLIGYNYFDPYKLLRQKIQTTKLLKELSTQDITKPNKQQAINDSINLVNVFYDNKIQNNIKKRKLDCIEKSNVKCLDSLKLLEK